MKNVEDIFSRLLDDLSEFLAERKGLLPLIAAGLVLLNFLLELIFPGAGITRLNLFLHLGVIVAILGFILARAL
ncbi:MAG: hypothetical protein JW757_00675 [Anaerolineales bacterium]|nr:hypothetical protein [Anaerolineales bacterium]